MMTWHPALAPEMPSLGRVCALKAAHSDSVWSVCWANVAGEVHLLSGSCDETVKLWRLDKSGDGPDGGALTGLSPSKEFTGEAVSVLGVISVAASDTGLAATSSLDSTVRVLDLADNTPKAVMQLPPGEVWALHFKPGADGARYLAVAGGCAAGAVVLDLEAQERCATYGLPAGVVEADAAGAFVLSVAYSPDGRRLACGAMGGTVAVFDTATQQLLHTLPGLSKGVRSLAWSSSGSLLAAACDDGHAHVYDAASGQLVSDLAGHSGAVLGVALTPDGTAAVTGGGDGSVRLWDVRTGACSQVLSGDHSLAVWGVAVSPSGGLVATCSDDHSLALLSLSP
jgi:WD repeat-containing protein 61